MRRPLVALATVAVALTALAAPAWAHVELDPGEVPANVPTALEIVVEHGCGTSPIAKVVTRLPAEAVDVTAVAPDGWTVVIAGNVVTWDGAARPLREDLRLGLTLTARAEPGTVLGFPTIESCPNGEEVRWIEDVPETDDESQRPLPRLEVVAGAPAPTTAPAAPAPTTATVPAATTTATTTTATSAPAAAGVVSTVAPTSSGAPAAATATTAPAAPATLVAVDEGTDGTAGALVFVGVVVVVAGAAAALVLRARRARRGGP